MKPETETAQNRYVSVKDMNHERGRLKGEVARSDLSARGEPFLWGLGGALVLGIAMVFGFLLLIAWNGIVTFYPKPIHVVTPRDGRIIAGEPSRTEMYRPTKEEIQSMDEESRKAILSEKGMARRTLYRIGNFDLYNEDFKWVPDYTVVDIAKPRDMFFIERLEWGPFIGTIRSLDLRGEVLQNSTLRWTFCRRRMTRPLRDAGGYTESSVVKSGWLTISWKRNGCLYAGSLSGMESTVRCIGLQRSNTRHVWQN